jgi:16S rRNA (uracil1498-N3)-methyltransferase
MNRPPRFAAAAPPDPDGLVFIAGPELHHLRNVMRLRAGAPLTVATPDGAEYAGTLVSCDRGRAVIRIASRCDAPRALPLALAAAIIKGTRMDVLVEKAAELGAAELWPIICARSVVRAAGAERLARWRRLAAAAAKQSLAPRTMEVREPLQFADLIRTAPRDTLRVICAIGAEPLGAVLARTKPAKMLAACGPEGDFTSAERDAAREAGFVEAGLGPNRLRSETAAIAALSIAADFLAAVRAD